LEEELREASLHDLLTGLHNRRGFFIIAGHQVKAAIRAKMNTMQRKTEDTKLALSWGTVVYDPESLE